MIKINENLKENPIISKETLPMLFEPEIQKLEDGSEYISGYYQRRDFYWDIDEDFNLIVETTLPINEELHANIKKILEKQKDLALIALEQWNKKLFAINEMLENN